MLKLADFRSRAKGLSDLLPYAALISPGVVLNKDGSLTAAWEIRGQDTASSTPDELAYISAQTSQAIKLLGSGWVLHVDAVRSSIRAYPQADKSNFPDRITQSIDDERRNYFSNDRCYRTNTILSVTYKQNITEQRIFGGLHSHTGINKSLFRFDNTLKEFEDILSSLLNMERMTEYPVQYDDGKTYIQSDLLSHLQYCVSGVLHPVRVPETPMYLDALLGSEDLIGGIVPKLGNQYILVLSIDGLPQESWPAMLAELDNLPIHYRFSTRYICLDQYQAIQEIHLYCKGWRQQVYRVIDQFLSNPNARENRDALLMAEDAEIAKTEVQSGYVGAGYLSSCIVLMHDALEPLHDWARELRRCIQTLGFGCRIESINAFEAWLGTIPGNTFANVRRPLINTLNLADLLPLASVWTGLPVHPCPFYPADSPPLAVCSTDGNTPILLTLHVGDIGHTLIFGPTGAGKSTLLAFLAAQFRRYKSAQIFVFDKGMSMYPLSQGAGGIHYDIGNSDTLAFAPLQRISESEEEFSWAAEWIESLLSLQGVAVTPGERNAIFIALDSLRSAPEDMRSLTDFCHRLQDLRLKEALRHYTEAGAMGRLLDARTDTLSTSAFTVFEIESLMNLGEKNLIPVLLYLFRRIERCLAGQPAMLILDEAWIMLGHQVFRDKIREWLKVLRKANCCVVLATQSLSDAKNSEILDVLAESCPTKIFLPNIAARQETQSSLYHDMGLNDRQIDIIANSMPKRDYYIASPLGRRKIQLALGPIALSFLGSSDKESITRIKELLALYGPDAWQEHWIEERTSRFR